jgi:hypothetical protein
MYPSIFIEAAFSNGGDGAFTDWYRKGKIVPTVNYGEKVSLH